MITEHSPPRPSRIASSNTNWGTCVVFPHPVAPLTTDARPPLMQRNTSSRMAHAGNAERFVCISRHLESISLRRSASARRADVSATRRAFASASASARSFALRRPPAPASVAAAAAATSSSSEAPATIVDAAALAPSRSSSPKPMLLTCLVSHESFFVEVGFTPASPASSPAPSAYSRSRPAARRPIDVSNAAAFSAAAALSAASLSAAAVSAARFAFVTAVLGCTTRRAKNISSAARVATFAASTRAA